ncbi:MAG TPA: hypothetical protein VHL11_23835 [Phototrophicaceae bacterium]|jgi:hypothetical protein|nr:hypothetical protein [Phototrophicaceae bacterium]
MIEVKTICEQIKTGEALIALMRESDDFSLPTDGGELMDKLNTWIYAGGGELDYGDQLLSVLMSEAIGSLNAEGKFIFGGIVETPAEFWQEDEPQQTLHILLGKSDVPTMIFSATWK